ncbi:MAG TPA: hypothetical protein VGV57_03235 [Thermoleophilaceae bacterium]|nr:hypothetical protein [Thermoleophilaceae bacterium]
MELLVALLERNATAAEQVIADVHTVAECTVEGECGGLALAHRPCRAEVNIPADFVQPLIQREVLLLRFAAPAHLLPSTRGADGW